MTKIDQVGDCTLSDLIAHSKLRTLAVLTMVATCASGCTEPPSCFKVSIRGVVEIGLEMHSDPRCVPSAGSGGFGDEYRGESDYPPWPTE